MRSRDCPFQVRNIWWDDPSTFALKIFLQNLRQTNFDSPLMFAVKLGKLVWILASSYWSKGAILQVKETSAWLPTTYAVRKNILLSLKLLLWSSELIIVETGSCLLSSASHFISKLIWAHFSAGRVGILGSLNLWFFRVSGFFLWVFVDWILDKATANKQVKQRNCCLVGEAISDQNTRCRKRCCHSTVSIWIVDNMIFCGPLWARFQISFYAQWSLLIFSTINPHLTEAHILTLSSPAVTPLPHQHYLQGIS